MTLPPTKRIGALINVINAAGGDHGFAIAHTRIERSLHR
jgi:hypothetical protein